MVWSGLLILRFTGQALQLPSAFQLPVSILAWGALFFILGYGIDASLMAGVGALVPSLREASQATTIMIIPLIIPLILISTLVNDPNSTLAVVLSLFPLTSPVAMITRLAAGSISPLAAGPRGGHPGRHRADHFRAVAGRSGRKTCSSGQELS